MSDKPEVVPYIVAFMHSPEYYNPYVSISRDTSCQCVEPLIRLSEHERISAADKARIDELEGLLRHIRNQIEGNIDVCVRDCVNQRGNVQEIYGYCEQITAHIDAALAKQGKEGGE